MTLEELFAATADLEPDERDAALARAAEQEPELASEVRALLAADGTAPDFLDHPALESYAVEEEPDPLLGTEVGAYRLEAVIGAGGMGTVYAARRSDERFDQQVAVKVLKRGLDTEEFVARFQAERSVLASLDHRYIVSILDGGELEDGRPYVVMERIDGRPVDGFCQDEGLLLKDRLDLFLGICDAIQHAHERFVVHRDLKPSNILVAADGTPRLLDFGIAKLVDGDDPGLTTAPDARSPMTLRYASPEQVRGDRVTTASDVYSLGLLLYRMLVGESAYQGPLASRADIERAVQEEDPVAPSRRLGPDTPIRAAALRGDLDTIVARALAKDPASRYATVQQLADDVRRHLEGHPILARRDAVAYRLGRLALRHRWPLLVAGALLIGLVTTLFALHSGAQRARDGEKIAWEAHGAAVWAVLALEDVLRDLATGSPSDRATLQRILADLGTRVAGELSRLGETEARIRLALADTYLLLGNRAAAHPHAQRALHLINTTQGFGRRDRTRAETLLENSKI